MPAPGQAAREGAGKPRYSAVSPGIGRIRRHMHDSQRPHGGYRRGPQRRFTDRDVIGRRRLSYYIAPLLNTSGPSEITAPPRAMILCGCAMLAGGLVYLNALHNPFVYDDFHTVVENPSLRSLANLPAIVLYAVTRPLVNLSYAIDYAVWGSGPFGFHLTSILLHMLNVALLFALAQRLAVDCGMTVRA